MDEFGKYLSVILPSMVKFFLGPVAGLALKLTWWETFVCTVTGMMLSVTLFTFLGRMIRLVWEDFRKTKRKRFSKSSRRAVKVYQKFGMAGIACLTPLLFTPIGGTLLAISFRVSPARILGWMLVFGSFWGLIIVLAIYNLPGVQKML